MGDDLMELKDTELNYICFETDSDDASSKSNEGSLWYKKAYFILNSLV